MILILAVFVVVARPLWLEMGSVICREVLVSVIYSHIHKSSYLIIHNIYSVCNASVSPGVVQHIITLQLSIC
jgi:hypothetical protein